MIEELIFGEHSIKIEDYFRNKDKPRKINEDILLVLLWCRHSLTTNEISIYISISWLTVKKHLEILERLKKVKRCIDGKRIVWHRKM